MEHKGILYLDAGTTRRLLDVPTALKVIEDVFRLQAEGAVISTDASLLALPFPAHNTRYRIKASGLANVPVAGIRVTGYHLDKDGMGSSAPDNTRFVVLSDPTTARPLAIIDEHWNYEIRTSASAVVAARHLARNGPVIVGIVGSGALAGTAVEALDEAFSVAEFRVTSRRKESRERFVAQMGPRVKAPLALHDTVEAVVRGATIVFTCTSANAVLVQADWLDPGVLVATLGQGELDPECYRRADKLVVDSWDVSKSTTDMRKLLEIGAVKPGDVYAEIQEIVVGRKPGRQRDDERIIVRAEGLVSQDVALADWVYRQALERGIGIRLPLGES
jgi:ornithine cyclodeaminase/alanine dehydrogenase-like protein (mu-crystallin family)